MLECAGTCIAMAPILSIKSIVVYFFSGRFGVSILLLLKKSNNIKSKF